MLLLQIMSVLSALTLVVLAYFMIPTLLEVRRTAASARHIAESMEVDLKPLIKKLGDTLADVQVITAATAANAEGVNLLLDELGQAGHNIRMINKVIGIVSEVAASSSAWMTGARVAGKYLADRLLRKKRG